MKNVIENPQHGITPQDSNKSLRGKRLVDELMVLYPAFAEICQDVKKYTAAIINWSLAIVGITDLEILRALECCKNEDSNFPPSAARFRRFAKGIIGSDVAFQLAIDNNQSNELVKKAKEKVGSYAFKNDSEHVLRRKFLATYQIICEEVLENKEEPENQPHFDSISREEFVEKLDKIFPIDESISENVQEYHKIRRQSMIEIYDMKNVPPGGMGEIL